MAENKKQDNHKITTIKLSSETKNRIEKLKEHPRETFEQILKKILNILNLIKINPEQARYNLNRIDETRKRLK